MGIWILFVLLILVALIILLALLIAIVLLAKIGKKLDKLISLQEKAPKSETTKMQVASQVSQAKVERAPETKKEEAGGMIICPKCYNGIDMNSKVCPVCQATLK